MYESPVNVVYNQMQTEVDNHIFKAIVNVGVDVNKEELVRALQYDRGQYEKGYKDGYDDGQAEIEKYTTNFGRVSKLIKAEAIKEYIEKVSIKLANNARSDYWRWIEDTLHEVEREMVGQKPESESDLSE